MRLSMLSEAEKENMEENNPEELIELKKGALNLGLDLQGGMHVVLEVDVKELLDKLARNKNKEFSDALDETEKIVNETDEDFITIFQENLAKKNMSIQRYYGNAERRTEADVVGFLRDQADEAVDRSLEILRNRVDEFGVSEPTIQKQGNRRIIVELAGISDPSRVRNIIGQTALLEFKLVKDAEVANNVAQKINDFISERFQKDTSATADASATELEEKDTTTTALEELFGIDTTETAGTDEAAGQEQIVFYQHPNDPSAIIIPAENEDRYKEILELPEIKKIIAEEAGAAEFVWSSNKEVGDQYLKAYLVEKKQEMTGESIIETQPQPGDPSDPSAIGKFQVSLTFNDEGARTFSRVTGANIGKRLAIILDNRVYLAPNIQVKINNGRARITGMETMESANDLSIVLEAGALPAPVKIIEERTVGPSLGLDSITAGSYSALIGLVIVMFFMIFYYRFSGMVADLALILNIMFIMAAMASLNATLTLPGIAGIILTIGMAVDANVLIFERIREELYKGKTIRAAIELGYEKAFITILDANVTTFIAGLILFTYGSGPIRGFAVTLMIGIVASMFTAIIVTRVIFNSYLNRFKTNTLSI